MRVNPAGCCDARAFTSVLSVSALLIVSKLSMLLSKFKLQRSSKNWSGSGKPVWSAVPQLNRAWQEMPQRPAKPNSPPGGLTSPSTIRRLWRPRVPIPLASSAGRARLSSKRWHGAEVRSRRPASWPLSCQRIQRKNRARFRANWRKRALGSGQDRLHADGEPAASACLGRPYFTGDYIGLARRKPDINKSWSRAMSA